MARIRLLAGDMTQIAGSATYCEELALRLNSIGHSVSVVCFGANQRLKDHCDVVEMGRSPWRQSPVAWRFAFQLDERHAFDFIRRAKLPEVDVVIGLEHMLLRPHHFQFPATPWLYVPLSLVAPIEIRSYSLGAIPTWLAAGKFHRIQSWALRHADATVRFSQMSCKLLDSYYGANCAKRFQTCDMPIEIPSVSSGGKPSGALRMLIVGRVTESKNFELPLRALAQLRQYCWKLDIIGDGPHLPVIRQLVTSLGLDEFITCHGKVPSTNAWYRSADLFLFTSKLDNCPLVVLESMSYGVPVLGIRPDGQTYISGIEEMIVNGDDGLLVDGEQSFVNSLEEVLNDPSRLQKLGLAARKRVESRNTWNGHISFFDSLLSKSIDGSFDAIMRSRTSRLAASV